MKANKQITAILTVLFIGFSTLNGQASARTVNKEKQERPSIKRAESNQVQQRQAQARVTQTQPRQTQAREVQSNQVRQREAQARVTQTQPRQTQAREVHTNQVQPRQTQAMVRQTQPRQTQTREVYSNPAREKPVTVQANKGPGQRSTTRYNTTATRAAVEHTRPTQISTPHYTKPNHGANHGKTPMKVNKYSEKRYYGGNHYHHFYPSNKVRTHYHHDTYIHHYNVLYYPAYHEIFWTRNMYRDYHRWYPNYRWSYKYGYRIQTISIFDARYNLGEVAMVYGRVYATWHNKETDDYLLFFGGDFPAQQFTVVLPGHVARKFSWRPERYFLGEHMTVTGLITTFDGIPEIIVKNRQQVGIY